jgi:hypothetical protein
MFVNKNAAYTIIRGLQVVGLGYALSPVVGYTTNHWWQQTLWALFDAVWVSVLFAVAAPVLNAAVRKVHGNIDAAFEKSATVALVLGAFYVSYGLIIGSLLPGPGLGIAHMLLISLVFVAIGTAYVTLVYISAALPRVFTLKFDATQLAEEKHVKVNLSEAIKEGNWSAAMFASTFVFGLGIVTSSAASGAFTNWGESIVTFLVAALIMLLVAGAGLWIIDKVVITNATLKQVIDSDQVHPAAITCAFMVFLFLNASWLVVG